MKVGKHGKIVPRQAPTSVRLMKRRYTVEETSDSVSIEEELQTYFRHMQEEALKPIKKRAKKKRVKKKVVITDSDNCIQCGVCVDVCKFDVLSLESGELEIIEVLCKGCGKCVKECTSQVLSLEEKK
jgi:ferredoxin